MDTVWQWLKGALLLGFIGLIAGAYQMPSLRTEFALALAFAFPVALLVGAVVKVADAGGRLFASSAVSAVAIAFLGGWLTYQGVEPPAPYGVAPLARDVELQVPESAPVLLEVHGIPEGRRERSARVRYQLDARRGASSHSLHGTLETEVDRSPSRGGPPSVKITRHWTGRHPVGGRGDRVRVHFRELPQVEEGELRARPSPAPG